MTDARPPEAEAGSTQPADGDVPPTAEPDPAPAPAPEASAPLPRSDSAFCTSCGSAIKRGAKFCGECGALQESADAAPAADSSAPLPKMPPWKPIVAVVAVLLLATVTFLVLTRRNNDKGASSTTATTAVSTKGWVTTKNDQYGFAVKHPKEWIVEQSNSAKLVLRFGPNSLFAVSVYDVGYQDAPKVIQELIKDANLQAKPAEFPVDGMDGIVYIYEAPPKDANSAASGVVQYYLLAKDKMYSLLFAVSPPEELNHVGSLVRTVAESFTSTLAKPAPTTTTTAAATTSTT